MPELIPVNILIADRSYRLKIEPEEEEMVRRSAAAINDKITEFKTNFAGKDMQDYVSMALLSFVTDRNTAGIDQVKWEDAVSKLSALEKLMDKALDGGQNIE